MVWCVRGRGEEAAGEEEEKKKERKKRERERKGKEKKRGSGEKGKRRTWEDPIAKTRKGRRVAARRQGVGKEKAR